MTYEVQAFIAAAMEIGLGARLAALTAEVETAIADFPRGPDRRYLARLKSQRDRLQSPDLPLIAALVTQLCAEEPGSWRVIDPVVRRMSEAHPCLARLIKAAP